MSSSGVEPSSSSGLEELRGQSCRGMCGPQTPRVAEAALGNYLSLLPAWQPDSSKTAISRSFVARNFVAAMEFLNAVAALAEEEGHHPDLHLTGYRNVRVDLSTHAIGGLSLPDFILASKIDALPVDYSPKWLEKQRAAGAAVPGALLPPGQAAGDQPPA